MGDDKTESFSFWEMYNLTANGSLFNTTGVPNISNISIQAPATILDKITEYFTLIALILIMLGMGCAIEFACLLAHLRRPIGPAIGMVCQIVFLPLSMFGVAHTLGLDTYSAVGLVVFAATPGGSMSNIFTYWADGDVPLR